MHPMSIVTQWGSRDLLESPPPPQFYNIFTNNAFGDPSPSSGTNSLYATLRRLVPRPLPANLNGYYELANRYARAFNPVLIDPTLTVNNEADTVFLMRMYIVTPVCAVLGTSTQYAVITTSEETVSDGRTICRVDLSFAVRLSDAITKTFAVLEFKRPGSIKLEEWTPIISGTGAIYGGADIICRQLHKYAAIRETPFVGVCDGLSLVLLQIGGTKETWKSDRPYSAQPNEAMYWWINDLNEMKRNLFLWLHGALEECITAWHQATIGDLVHYVPG